MIDEKMQSGYDLLAEGQGDVQQACRLWLEAWQGILRVMQQQQLSSFQEFDDQFDGINSVEKDAGRAAQLLKQGLDVTDIEDRDILLERLQTVYEKSGREDEAEAVRQERQRSGKVDATPTVTTTAADMQTNTTLEFGQEGLPLEELDTQSQSHSGGSRLPTGQTSSDGDMPRVGRNSPCPCGSGKKYKKCCGRR